MSDIKHPLLRLLGHTDLQVFLTEINYQFFNKLETALTEDSKSRADTGEAEATFAMPLADTNDLFQNQAPTLHAMIEGWALSAMSPLVSTLNDYCNNSDEIILYLDGDLLSAHLYFDNVDEYISSIDKEDVADIKAELSGWTNSCALINDFDEFVAKLDALADS
ncbi:hypothetical protein ACTXIV_13135 [Psychrobacter celer]|uniref:hypothetical protein n=1 Tax=Psychrobacter celer TaxID=306572 RepID=UPI003FD1E963